ncbi:MAG: DUF1343 domain-containing protein [Bacteroidota bacterium]
MNIKPLILLAAILLSCQDTSGERESNPIEKSIVVGAERMDLYLTDLKDKRIALVVNQTSMVKDVHLVDTLLSRGIDIVKVFSPEHGFRGTADAGEAVSSGIDPTTKLPLVSLYGKNKKPTAEQLSDVDVVIFDIQDVGTRFYTYISTMHYVMETCAEQDKSVIVLDRPNPNGMYVDGPVLEPEHSSFVGLHPIPIVHGLTVGELAKMINGEGWLKDGLTCQLKVIENEHYNHSSEYSLPIKPSPNLPNDEAIALYPSLCLFEGTIVSVGRGTPHPFQVIGHPTRGLGAYTFKPASNAGASRPKYESELCYGKSFVKSKIKRELNLGYLINSYKLLSKNGDFFNNYFVKLAGTSDLRKQIESGVSEPDIRESWQGKLTQYKTIRKKYLLYPDFE